MDWFERLTGFREADYAQTRSRMVIEGDRLRSRVNGKSYRIGQFGLPSLAELRQQVRAQPGKLTTRIVSGDVRALHGHPAFAGALFQVASQFNMLEMVGPGVSPEDGVTRYELTAGFYRLISVRLDRSIVGPGYNLHAFTPQDEPGLRYVASAWPTHYELQAGHIELLPAPPGGLEVIIEYIPSHQDLVEDDDELNGYDGWEEYVVNYAARQVALKDEEYALARTLERDNEKLTARIQKLAPNRDAFRAERVKDTRQTRFFVGRRRGLE